MEQSTGHPCSNGGGKLESEGTVWRGRGAAGEPPVELTAVAAHGGGAPGSDEHLGARVRRGAAVRRAGAPRLEVAAGPHPFGSGSCSPEHPLEAANVQIVAAQVRSNGCDGPQGGRYFIYRPPPVVVSLPDHARVSVCALSNSAVAAVSHVPAFAVPCVRLGGRQWRHRRHRISRRACLRFIRKACRHRAEEWLAARAGRRRTQ